MTARTIRITKLPEKAEPIEWTLLAASRMQDEIRLHRYMNCPHYSKCLDHSSLRYWGGWSCYWCSFNENKGSKIEPQPKKKPEPEKEHNDSSEKTGEECNFCKGKGTIPRIISWDGREKTVDSFCSFCGGEGKI